MRRPVEHLREVAGLKGDNAEDDEPNRQQLKWRKILIYDKTTNFGSRDQY